MFEYFPPAPTPGTSASSPTLNSGGLIDEVDRACRPIKDAANAGEDAGTPDFLRAWTALTDQLVGQAEEAEKAGHTRTAGQLYSRATNYLCQAERMLAALRPEPGPDVPAAAGARAEGVRHSQPADQPGRRPLRGDDAAGLLQPAPRQRRRPAPVIVLVNGLDSTKEHMYRSDHWAELAARGISCLMLDQPGTGEALRLQGLTARIDAEAWAGAAVDYLRDPRPTSTPPGSASSAGRSAATTPRAPPRSRSGSRWCVAWGANHDWGAVQRRRLEREGERPVPHYWEHVLWVWGRRRAPLDASSTSPTDVNLDGVVEQITVPFLIAHGANDRQIPVEYAHRSYDQAVNSPKRELRIFTAEEGATEHIGLDHLPHVSVFIADWVADTFSQLP